jgi:hypothetical protein
MVDESERKKDSVTGLHHHETTVETDGDTVNQTRDKKAADQEELGVVDINICTEQLKEGHH